MRPALQLAMYRLPLLSKAMPTGADRPLASFTGPAAASGGQKKASDKSRIKPHETALLSGMGEDLLGGEKPVERGREAGVYGHLHDDFHDFIPGKANIQSGLDVHH